MRAWPSSLGLLPLVLGCSQELVLFQPLEEGARSILLLSAQDDQLSVEAHDVGDVTDRLVFSVAADPDGLELVVLSYDVPLANLGLSAGTLQTSAEPRTGFVPVPLDALVAERWTNEDRQWQPFQLGSAYGDLWLQGTPRCDAFAGEVLEPPWVGSVRAIFSHEGRFVVVLEGPEDAIVLSVTVDGDVSEISRTPGLATLDAALTPDGTLFISTKDTPSASPEIFYGPLDGQITQRLPERPSPLNEATFIRVAGATEAERTVFALEATELGVTTGHLDMYRGGRWTRVYETDELRVLEALGVVDADHAYAAIESKFNAKKEILEVTNGTAELKETASNNLFQVIEYIAENDMLLAAQGNGRVYQRMNDEWIELDIPPSTFNHRSLTGWRDGFIAGGDRGEIVQFDPLFGFCPSVEHIGDELEEHVYFLGNLDGVVLASLLQTDGTPKLVLLRPIDGT